MANKLKIRKGDRVKVIAGRSKGKIGDVLRVIAADERVVVSGVNVIKRHTKTVREALTKEFSYKNAFEVPKLDKIVINMGVGEAVNDRKAVDAAVAELAAITGQKPVITKSRLSIATFKLREGMAIGAKVTLRRDRMYEFIDRLINIALPRVRDFRGLNGKSFDGNGNFAMGLKEQLVFPEIDYDKVDQVRGMDIIICTSAKTDAEAKALLRAFDFPFVN